MQAQYFWKLPFRSAKIVFYPKKIIYPLLLPSHNCIIFSMFSFQGAFESLKKLNEASTWVGTSVNFLRLVEISGIEPLTSCLQGRRSPSWAKPPYPFLMLFKKWWAKMDSNHRPHDYQSCALASWAIGPFFPSSLLRYILSIPCKLNNASSSEHFVLTLGRYK